MSQTGSAGAEAVAGAADAAGAGELEAAEALLEVDGIMAWLD